jgi:3-deoxy-D-manno-octulosonic-acid transferase
LLYHLAITIYHTALRIAALWHPKAQLWVNGRKGLLDRIEREVRSHQGRTVWVNCASLGEFEMARPIMEEMKAGPNPPRIVLTFFSPSGYEIRKDYAGADHVFYLPLDREANAQRFMAAVQPDVAVFVKYDLWWHFLKAAKAHGAQLVLISAVFAQRQHFFKWYGGHGRRCLRLFDRIFTVDDDSVKLLREIGIDHAESVGDTRYDRVMEVAAHWSGFPSIERFKGESKLVVCGSTWVEDEVVIRKAMAQFPDVKWIMAPHEVGDANIKRMERMFPSAERFSGYTDQQTNMLIVDSIGVLNRLYGHGDVAYVGGGFGRVLHNILEATAYGIPVIFGPDHASFPDAGRMARQGLVFSIRDAEGLSVALRRCLDAGVKQEEILGFMRQRTGAKEAVLRFLGR